MDTVHTVRFECVAANTDLQAVAQHCPRLRRLVLAGGCTADTAVAAVVVEKCTELRQLSFNAIAQSDHAIFSALCAHPRLQSIAIGAPRFNNLSMKDIAAALAAHARPRLVDLVVRNATGNADDLTALCAALVQSSIRYLSVDTSRGLATDAAARTIATHLPKLEELQLGQEEQRGFGGMPGARTAPESDEPLVLPESVLALAAHGLTPRLQSTTIRRLMLHDIDSAKLDTVVAACAELPDLRELALAYVGSLANSDSFAPLANATWLESVGIIGFDACCAVAAVCDLQYVTKLQVQHMDLSHMFGGFGAPPSNTARATSWLSLQPLAKMCRLKELMLAGTPDDTFRPDALRGLTALAQLHVHGCNDFGVEHATVLADTATHLKRLELSDCHSVDDACLEQLLRLRSLYAFGVSSREVTQSTIALFAERAPALLHIRCSTETAARFSAASLAPRPNVGLGVRTIRRPQWDNALKDGVNDDDDDDEDGAQ